MERIGFIGIGLMGHGMAKNLLAKGHSLAFKVHRNRANLADLTAAGAVEVKDTRSLVAASDIVFFCVTGSPQVEEIIYGADGLLATARDGMLVVDCSTSEPTSTARIRADLAERGVAYIDAPLARTPKEAEEGRLNTMVGADDANFERLQPVMKAFCENVIHVGPPGHGHVLKLVNNFLALSIATSTAEAFTIAAKSGLSLRKLLEVITAGGVNSGVFQMIAEQGGRRRSDRNEVHDRQRPQGHELLHASGRIARRRQLRRRGGASVAGAGGSTRPRRTIHAFADRGAREVKRYQDRSALMHHDVRARERMTL